MHRENYKASDPSSYFKVSLTIPLLDQIITELRSRFSLDHRIHLKSNFIIPSVVVKNKSWKENIIEFSKNYESDLPQVINLTTELDQWEIFWRQEICKGVRVPDTISETLTVINPKKDWYPNIYAILCLVAVVPSSSNS